jgi:CelD/BcsL family acetyltransferase involved in cellulose biosynthesis
VTESSANVHLSLYGDLAAAERDWCAFEQRADCSVFQSFAWLSTWQLHIGNRKGVRPVIVIGRDAGDEIMFLLPLAVAPHGLARRLMWLGSENNDYNAPLLAPEFPHKLGPIRFLSLWPEIVELIQRQHDLRFDLIHFERMPEKLGSQPNPFRNLPVTMHPNGIYLTHLNGEWETFYASKRSSSTRQRDRTKRKRLGDLGEVKLVTPESADEIASSFTTLMSQKARSFAAMGADNIFERPGYPQFYGSLAIASATRHIAHVSRLDVGAIPAAVNLGLTFRGCYYHLLASYADGEVSRYGPGAVHLHELMRHAIAGGCTVFDFTVGDETYKRDWADTESILFDHVAAARWRGRLIAPVLLGRIRLERFIKQTPAAWRMFTKARASMGKLRSKATRANRRLSARAGRPQERQ